MYISIALLVGRFISIAVLVGRYRDPEGGTNSFCAITANGLLDKPHHEILL